MCGIVAILTRPATRPVPAAAELIEQLDAASAAVDLPTATEHLRLVNGWLLGAPGVEALVERPDVVAEIVARLSRLDAVAQAEEARVEALDAASADLERANADLIALRDVLWAIRNDRLRTASAVGGLAGRGAGRAALRGFTAVQQALSAIDRMEVRGRDSAGLHLYVWDHGLDPADPAFAAALQQRSSDALFTSGSVRFTDNVLSFVYKAAAEIGELATYLLIRPGR